MVKFLPSVINYQPQGKNIVSDNYWLPFPVSSSYENNLLAHPQHTQNNGGSDKRHLPDNMGPE